MIEFLLRKLETTKQWGWVLYRTVYTPGSDQRCQEAMARLEELIIENYHANNDDATPEQHTEVLSKLNLVLLENPAFEHTSLADLRTHFKEWAYQQEHFHDGARPVDPRWEVFLLLDESAVDKILSAPEERLHKWQEYCITAVQAEFPGGPQWKTDEERRADEELDAGDYSNDEEDYEYDDEPPNWPGQVDVGVCFLLMFWHHMLFDEMWLEKCWLEAQKGEGVWPYF